VSAAPTASKPTAPLQIMANVITATVVLLVAGLACAASRKATAAKAPIPIGTRQGTRSGRDTAISTSSPACTEAGSRPP
jgi:hypothetical protein